MAEIDYNALAQAIDTTWGRSSTPKTASYSIKLSLQGSDTLLASYAALVNFGTEHQMIEMKRNPNRPTPEQLAFIADAETEGWQCHVCYSSAEAITVIEDYLSHPATHEQD